VIRKNLKKINSLSPDKYLITPAQSFSYEILFADLDSTRVILTDVYFDYGKKHTQLKAIFYKNQNW